MSRRARIRRWIGNSGQGTFHTFHDQLWLLSAHNPCRYFSFDVITALSFGEPVGFLDSKSDVQGLITNMDKSMYRQKLSLYPPVAWFARNTVIGRRMFISRRTDKSGLGLFMAVRLNSSHSDCSNR